MAAPRHEAVHLPMTSTRVLQRWWTPLVSYAAGISLLAYLAYMVVRTVWQCCDGFSYALDDAYIHMGLARRLAQDGLWGVGDGFASAASSVVWPLALALVYWVKGPDLYTPLIFEFIGVTGLLILVQRIASRECPSLARRGWLAGLVAVAVAMAAPVNTLVLSGLEHIWHIVVLIFALDRAVLAFADDTGPSIRRTAERQLLLAAPLLTLVRFETMVLVPVLMALAVVRRRGWLALGLGVAAFAPVLAFGWWSQAQGGNFWPNSLVLKAVRHAPGQPIWSKVHALVIRLVYMWPSNQAYLYLLLLSFFNGLVAACVFRRWRAPAVLMIGLFLVQALAHAGFGGLGWLFRYEAYLLAGGTFANLYACACIARRIREQRSSTGRRWHVSIPQFVALSIFVGLATTLTYHLVERARDAARITPRAVRNIYEQQVQFARFLQRYYPRSAVALNDIGAASYFTDIRLLDLFGLGSNAIVRMKVEKGFTLDAIARLVDEREIEIAIVYDTWFVDIGGLPDTWTKVGEWEIRENEVCGSPIVSFYAVKPDGVAALERNLADFSERLPVTVVQRGAFLRRVPGVPPGTTVIDHAADGTTSGAGS